MPPMYQVCSFQNTLRFLSKLLLSFSYLLSSVATGLNIRELKVWSLSCWEFRRTRNSLESRLNYFYTMWTLSKRKCGQLYKFYMEIPSNRGSYQKILSRYVKQSNWSNDLNVFVPEYTAKHIQICNRTSKMRWLHGQRPQYLSIRNGQIQQAENEFLTQLNSSSSANWI